MEIQLIGVKGQPNFASVADLVAAAPALGLNQTGVETATHLLPELQGLPKFKELAGPMGNGKTRDGEPRIRYETWEANDLYSR
jgi:hypothetical protein